MSIYHGDFAVGQVGHLGVFIGTILPEKVTPDSLNRLRTAVTLSKLDTRIESFGITVEDELVYVHAFVSLTRTSEAQAAIMFSQLRALMRNVGIQLDPRPCRFGGLPEPLSQEIMEQLH